MNSKAWLAWSLQSHICSAVPGVSTLPLTSRHRPDAELTRGAADAGNDPTSLTTRKAYDLLSDGFGPGFNGQFILVSRVDGPQQLHVSDFPAFAEIAKARVEIEFNRKEGND